MYVSICPYDIAMNMGWVAISVFHLDSCQGGWPSVAWNYARTTGIVTGGDFGTKKGCQTYPFAPCAHHVVSEKYEPCGPIQPTPRCQHHCEVCQIDILFMFRIHHKITLLINGTFPAPTLSVVKRIWWLKSTIMDPWRLPLKFTEM